MNRKKPLAAALVALLAAAVALWWWLRPMPPSDQLMLYGNVDLRQVSLAFSGSERIAELGVREGDRVRAGQVVGRLDTRALQLQAAQAKARIGVQEQALQRLRNGSRPEEIAQARAQVSAAQADTELAARQLARLQAAGQDTEGRAVSRQDVDAAQARRQVAQARLDGAREALRLAIAGPRREDIGQAQAQLEAARADLALIDHQLAEAELRAPIDAVVRTRLLEPGDMASPQRPVLALAITDPKWVRAYVAEPDLGRVQPGQAAQVMTDSHPGQALAGRIGHIASVAEFTPRTVQTEELRTSLVYEIRVTVDDPGDRLRLGMPATVQLRTAPASAGGR